jgi:predicted RNase H-like HicB family nuclease
VTCDKIGIGRAFRLVEWARMRYSSSMKLPKLTAVIEREDDWFVATCPELGVASQGRTIEEAERMIKEAVEILLEDADDKEIERRLNRGVKVTSLEPAHA